jgi:hypothetical protein
MDKARLSLLTFPQRWDGQCLRASVLLLPRGDPLHAPLWDQGAAFAGMPLTLQLELQNGGEVFSPGRRGNRSVVFTPPPAARSRELFGTLHERFLPTPPPTAAHTLARFREAHRARLAALGPVRMVPSESYLDAVDGAARRDMAPAMSPAEYAQRLSGSTADSLDANSDHMSWGEVVANALRVPALSRELGLVVDFDTHFTGWDVASLLAGGGWLGVSLAAAPGDAPPPGRALSFAARIPPLTAQPRALFAAVLFNAEASAPAAASRQWLAEADAYSDGFAHVVHASRLRPAGLAIGWDDEQVLGWVQRQLDAACASDDPLALCGVAGYRLDVREPGGTDSDWQSLCHASGRLSLGTWHSDFDGEWRIDVAALMAGSAEAPFVYLPRHFALWRGGSLVVPGENVPAWRPGARHEFRVRLVDLSGGGPASDEVSPEAYSSHPA